MKQNTKLESLHINGYKKVMPPTLYIKSNVSFVSTLKDVRTQWQGRVGEKAIYVDREREKDWP